MSTGDTPVARTSGSTQLTVTTVAELRTVVAAARRAGRKIGVVPTMGALHAGHLSLVEACGRECDFTITTIFVNPTQFAAGEDYEKYPQQLEADLAALRPYEVEVVFAPPPSEMYRPGHDTFVEVGAVTEPLEGASRPGHFRGVATIVLKLFNQTTPDVAYFGLKDYQQSLVVRQMVADLDLPITLRLCPIVREPDGLAMSSRNAYLDPEARQQALALSQSLRAAGELFAQGERRGDVILDAMRAVFAEVPEVRIDYLAVVDPETLAPVDRIEDRALAAVSAFVGPARLIDNRMLGGQSDENAVANNDTDGAPP